jgi:hypothetical protein
MSALSNIHATPHFVAHFIARFVVYASSQDLFEPTLGQPDRDTRRAFMPALYPLPSVPPSRLGGEKRASAVSKKTGEADRSENRSWSSCRILIAIAIGIDFLPASTVRVAVRVDRRCLLAVNESGDESGSRLPAVITLSPHFVAHFVALFVVYTSSHVLSAIPHRRLEHGPASRS